MISWQIDFGGSECVRGNKLYSDLHGLTNRWHQVLM
jgi:hypothetical protein